MSARCVVLTLGRLPVALDLARGFAAIGYRVVVAEPFSMHMCGMSRAVAKSVRVSDPREDADAYLDDLERVVVDEQATLVVPVSEETPRVAALRQRLPDDVRVFSGPQDHVLALHDKYRFVETARSLGLDAPASRLPDAADDLHASDGYVIKPRYSCSGRGVRFSEEPGGASGDEFVQARVAGEEVSGFAVARDGRLLVSTTYRATVTSGSVAVCFDGTEPVPAAERWMETFVAATKHTGFIAFDFILDIDGRCWALECNPRATSGLHFVEPPDLARLIAGVAESATAKRGKLTESWSCFTALLGSLPDRRRFARIFRELREARDVSWRASDPLPFVLMPINTAPLLARALRARETIAAVAMRDLEWREPPPIPS